MIKRFHKILPIAFTIFTSIVLSVPLFAENRDSVRTVSPRKALLTALVFPGAGQIYIHRPLKAVVHASSEIFFICKTLEYNKIYGYVKETKNSVGIDKWNYMDEEAKKKAIFDSTGYMLKINSWRPREKRNKYSWWCAGIYLFSILDAYVDAHLMNFPKNDIEISTITDQNSIGLNISFLIRGKANE